MAINDLSTPLTDFLSGAQAARLTPSAKKLTKETMLQAMNSYAGGHLVQGLTKEDIFSVRDAFRERTSMVGAEVGGGGSCCCCCAAVGSPTKVGPLRLASISDIRQAFGTSMAGKDDEGGGSCCCCCL